MNIIAFEAMMKGVVPAECIAIQPFKQTKGKNPSGITNYSHEFL
jgi:hypothetical protein